MIGYYGAFLKLNLRQKFSFVPVKVYFEVGFVAKINAQFPAKLKLQALSSTVPLPY
jgi:hypothetical protein